MTAGQVLRYHAKMYPLMRPTDAVKLLYQNEFGGGHLIANPQDSLLRLEKEFISVRHDPGIPLTVPIGNGIVRVNLAAIDANRLPLDVLNDVFVESSKCTHGELCSFREKIKLLQLLTDNKIFSFDADELHGYIYHYSMQGYPAVSHSEEYRDAYQPAYRVVSEALLLRNIAL